MTTGWGEEVKAKLQEKDLYEIKKRLNLAHKWKFHE